MDFQNTARKIKKGKLMSREGSIHVADQILMMILLYLQRMA